MVRRFEKSVGEMVMFEREAEIFVDFGDFEVF
jgi:hypothetical protein